MNTNSLSNQSSSMHYWGESLQERSDGAITNLIALDETFLAHNSSLDSLSNKSLFSHFKDHIQKLHQTQNPEQYSFHLREAEQALLKLEKNSSSSQYDLVGSRNELQTFFQNSPDGPSKLMQLDIDCIKRWDIVPFNIDCSNSQGEKFFKPAISINSLIGHFNWLGYSKIMFSRAPKDFKFIDAVCDIISLKLDLNFPNINFFNRVDKNLDEQVIKVNDYFNNNNLAQNLGYASSTSMRIKDVEDKALCKLLTEQEFDICTILIYKRFELISRI
ncbi:MAG: hypothetical protein H0V82_04510 [Candidatus Protochlamydia sp.]|nr:hypothetical protein [Candidatus Protochlamydia sp.]